MQTKKFKRVSITAILEVHRRLSQRIKFAEICLETLTQRRSKEVSKIVKDLVLLKDLSSSQLKS